MTTKISEMICTECGEKEELTFLVTTKNGNTIWVKQDGTIDDTNDDAVELDVHISNYLSLIDFEEGVFVECLGICEEYADVTCTFDDGTTFDDEEDIFKKLFL